MRIHAQAVVIGGGLIGCSILYHLTRAGWSDVVLLERSELTSGSTWHAAANIHGLHDSTNISRMQHYTMQLYRQLEAETGQGCGVFQPGSLYLAQTEERVQQLRLQEAKARRYGMAFHEVSRGVGPRSTATRRSSPPSRSLTEAGSCAPDRARSTRHGSSMPPVSGRERWRRWRASRCHSFRPSTSIS